MPPATATRLITGISMQTNAAASPRIDLTVVPVEWLNNLSSDSRYSNLPRKLSALTEPTYNGYPSATAHNTVNMILVANAASAAAVYYASLMPMLVKRNVPVRFGAIFYTDNVLQVTVSACICSQSVPSKYFLFNFETELPSSYTFVSSQRHLFTPHWRNLHTTLPATTMTRHRPL